MLDAIVCGEPVPSTGFKYIKANQEQCMHTYFILISN